MTRLYSNNFTTTLNGAITDVATSITLTSVTGFPAVGSGDTAQITLVGGGNTEVVTATAIAGSVVTITRAQEGTSGVAFSDLDIVGLRVTTLSHTDVLAADLTPTIAGPLDCSASYLKFGVSSTSSAYNISNSGGVPYMRGASGYYYSFVGSSIYFQAGSSADSFKFSTSSLDITTSSVIRMSINDSGMRLAAAGARVSTILDEDDMTTDSDTALATQQSIKAYADTKIDGGEFTTSTNVLKSSVAPTSTGAFIRATVSSAANPTYAFHDDTNTGMYRPSTDTLSFSSGGVLRLNIDSTAADFSVPIKASNYAVAGVPSASTSGAGSMIYVSDETGGAVIAFSDGTDWRRVTDRVVIS